MTGPFIELRRLEDGRRFFLNVAHITTIALTDDQRTRIFLDSGDQLTITEDLDDVVTRIRAATQGAPPPGQSQSLG